MEDVLAIVLLAVTVKTKNSSSSSHLSVTKHERQGKKQRKREGNRGRGGEGKQTAEYTPQIFGKAEEVGGKAEETRGIPGGRGSTRPRQGRAGADGCADSRQRQSRDVRSRGGRPVDWSRGAAKRSSR